MRPISRVDVVLMMPAEPNEHDWASRPNATRSTPLTLDCASRSAAAANFIADLSTDCRTDAMAFVAKDGGECN
jgi:hypothetical protein